MNSDYKLIIVSKNDTITDVMETINKVGSRIDKFILAMYFSASDFAVYSISQYRIPVINLIFPSVSNL